MDAKRIFFVGVGGQGNILATKLVGEAALIAGIPVTMSETHGMAQRGGVVESTAVIGAKSPIISNYTSDIIVAFEPLEALRAIEKGNSDTTVIMSISCITPFTVAIGRSSYPDVRQAIDYIKSKVKKVVAFDAMAEAIAEQNPLGVNMVMVGALYASGILPLSEKNFIEAIKTTTNQAFVEKNIACFERGINAFKNAV
jgi:indolepyruvate ferredoxin oxidoreductase beta subunit